MKTENWFYEKLSTFLRLVRWEEKVAENSTGFVERKAWEAKGMLFQYSYPTFSWTHISCNSNLWTKQHPPFLPSLDINYCQIIQQWVDLQCGGLHGSNLRRVWIDMYFSPFSRSFKLMGQVILLFKLINKVMRQVIIDNGLEHNCLNILF